MRYDHLEENYRYTTWVGCGGCLIYIILFAFTGAVILAYDLPSALSIPVLALFVILWLISFIYARSLDRKKHGKKI